ncbi:hypothetical protein [Methanimicrococcus hacksteinii]|nr:hypothetical protein [Methanimicrococcus sp. At1]
MYHLIFSTSARYASVGTDYLADSVCRCYLAVSVCRCCLPITNTVADLPACSLSLLLSLLPSPSARDRRKS